MGVWLGWGVVMIKVLQLGLFIHLYDGAISILSINTIITNACKQVAA